MVTSPSCEVQIEKLQKPDTSLLALCGDNNIISHFAQACRSAIAGILSACMICRMSRFRKPGKHRSDLAAPQSSLQEGAEILS